MKPKPNDMACDFEEPVLRAIDRDLEERPGCLKPLPQALFDRIAQITADVKVDLDARLDGDVDR